MPKEAWTPTSQRALMSEISKTEAVDAKGSYTEARLYNLAERSQKIEFLTYMLYTELERMIYGTSSDSSKGNVQATNSLNSKSMSVLQQKVFDSQNSTLKNIDGIQSLINELKNNVGISDSSSNQQEKNDFGHNEIIG